jgi:hypothetical protein
MTEYEILTLIAEYASAIVGIIGLFIAWQARRRVD